MKRGFLAVCLWLLVALSAEATFVRIDQQLTTPNLLVFDIGWRISGEEGSDESFLDPNGNLLWKGSLKDQFPTSLRSIDVDVQTWRPGFRVDSWSFYYDEQRHFTSLDSDWRWDEQRQSGERTATAPEWWELTTFTLIDPYSARVTYAVPEPGVLAIGALFAGLYALHRKL